MQKFSSSYFLLKLFIYIFFVSIGLSSYAQKGGIPLAEEYFQAGEYAKAKAIYENFTEKYDDAKKIYANYIECLVKLKENEKAEKFLKKCIKWDEQNIEYKVDLADFYIKTGKNNDAKRQFDRVLAFSRDFPEQTSITAKYLIKLGYMAQAKAVYMQGRKLTRNDAEFSLEMAEIYKYEKNTEDMLRELIRVLLMNQNDKEFLKSKFQDFITTEDEFKKFEAEIIARLQDDPTQYLYNDLLIWTYVQQKLFYKAFIQTRAYDKLMKLNGNKLMEVGRITMENKDYETAIEIFGYITANYQSSQNYVLARKLKIQAREEIVKSTFPISQTQIRSLIADYQLFIAEQGRSRETLDAIRNMALLYGFYADSKDTATMLLESIVKTPWVEPIFSAKCKIDLGDIYLLKNEPWEATLIYSQVEKSQKDQPLGHEAKLRNAKLDYYTGQFEFAKEHLDVLKLATHREIANDAMDLSLFIQDNTTSDQDSNHTALKTYAEAELLLFQNKYSAAMLALDTLLKKNKGHSLEDDIYFLQAKIFKKTLRFEEALQKLEIIEKNYKSDILGDDAAFLTAQIYEENLGDKQKAMELYNKFLLDFPSSIYTAEARKRYRVLRGDTLN